MYLMTENKQRSNALRIHSCNYAAAKYVNNVEQQLTRYKLHISSDRLEM